jgi:hypothetical protein
MPDNQIQADAKLDPNKILIAEYNYVAQSAFQANEDRARISNYYFVTVAAAVAAILGAKPDPTVATAVYVGFTCLFIVLSAIGFTTVLELARLRVAWDKTAYAMDTVKQFYLLHCTHPKLDAAFLWKMESVPTGEDPGNIASLMAYSIHFISVGTAAAAVVYGGQALVSLSDPHLNIPAWVFGIVGVVLGGVYGWYQRRVYWKWVLDGSKRARDQAFTHKSANQSNQTVMNETTEARTAVGTQIDS